MTDVRDFWETVAQGYITSLQNVLSDGRQQYAVLIDRFIGYLERRSLEGREATFAHWPSGRSAKLKERPRHRAQDLRQETSEGNASLPGHDSRLDLPELRRL